MVNISLRTGFSYLFKQWYYKALFKKASFDFAVVCVGGGVVRTLSFWTLPYNVSEEFYIDPLLFNINMKLLREESLLHVEDTSFYCNVHYLFTKAAIRTFDH